MKFLMNGATVAIVLLIAIWLTLIFNICQSALHLDNFVNTTSVEADMRIAR